MVVRPAKSLVLSGGHADGQERSVKAGRIVSKEGMLSEIALEFFRRVILIGYGCALILLALFFND